MKKKTKKKLLKGGKFILKLLVVYPAKALFFIGKKAVSGTKTAGKKIDEKRIENYRPKVEPKFDPLLEVKNKKGDLNKFDNKIFSNKSTIGLILGARGTGKSAIGMRLLENYRSKTNKEIYAMGFKKEPLPKWINVVKSIDEIQNNSVILIDEGGIEFSSRKAMSGANKLLSELLLVARHKDLSVMFITQNSANLEINAIRQADYLILKPSSLLQKDFERQKIKKIYQSVEEEFEELRDTEGITYLYTDIYQGFVTNSLPSFWGEKVSKGFA